MNTLESIKTRRSIRKYKKRPGAAGTAEQNYRRGSVRAERHGQTGNDHSFRCQQRGTGSAFQTECPDHGYGYGSVLRRAAVLIVLAKKDCPTGIYDGSLVMQNLMLAAHELGLGSCWIHRAKEEFELPEGRELLKSLGIEDEYEGIGHCIIGYADGDAPSPAERKEHRVYSVD